MRATVLAVVGTLALAGAAQGATTYSEATGKALKALDVREQRGPVIVFGSKKPLARGTAVRESGVKTPPARTTVSLRRDGGSRKRRRMLERVDAFTAPAPVVLRAGGEPAYLFFQDTAPHVAWRHRGRVVLVGVRSGKVRVSRWLGWPPAIGARLPKFLRTKKAYSSDRFRVFERDWAAGSRAATASSASWLDALAASVPSARAAARGRARRAANDRLAADGACVVKVGDTLGTFYDRGAFAAAEQTLGGLFSRFSRDGRWLKYHVRSRLTPAAFVSRKAIRGKGCDEVLVYLAGSGYPGLRDAAVNVGNRVSPLGLGVHMQDVRESALRGLVRRHLGVTFHLLVDAPFSGGFIRLADEPNVAVVATASAARKEAFTYLPANKANPAGALEFTNRMVNGLSDFLGSMVEVEAFDFAQQGVPTTARASAASGDMTYFGWMLGRAFELGEDVDLASTLGLAPQIAFGGGPDGEGPPGQIKKRPTADAQSVTTPEDTAKAITLTASDPRKRPLTYAVTVHPTHGTLSGTAPNLTYTPDASFTGSDSFQFTATNDRGNVSDAATVDIAVTPVNDVPVVTTSAGSTPWKEGDPAAAVDSALTVTDLDDTSLESATVAIASGLRTGDVLEFSDQNGIAGSYDGGKGVLTLSGSATLADYQAALRTVAFRNTGDDPLTSRTIEFVVNDGDADSAGATKAIAVSPVNDAPTVTATVADLAYEEGDPATAVDSALAVADVDDANLEGATVAITANFASAEDALAFTDQNGISGSYDAGTGVLTLSGTATVAQYQAALRSVTYENDSNDPSAAERTVSFTVDDGDAKSAVATRGIAVGPVNDAPTIATSGGSTSWAEGDPAVVVDSSVSIGDADDTQLEGATVSISAGFRSGDELVFVDQSGITGAYNTGTGVLTLSGAASLAVYESALESVEFENTGDDPGTARTISFTVNDGDADSSAATKGIDVTPVNDAPTVTTTSSDLAYAEGDGAVAIDPGVAVSDPDDTQLDGATVAITGDFVAAQDALAFTDQNGISGSYDDGTGVLTLTGSATVADYRDALASVTYANESQNPSPGTRTITFRVSDGDVLSTAATRTVALSPSNDAPTIATSGGSTSWTEGDPAAVVDSSVSIGDADDTQLEGAQVSISAGFRSGDELVFVNQGGISGVYNTGTGVLALTGAASLADYETALESVEFQNAGDDPGIARTISFTVNDGDADSSAATKGIDVTPVNDPPTVATTSADLDYTENDGPVAVDSGLTVDDPDDTQLEGGTVAIGANFVEAEDALAFTDQSGIAGSYDDTTGVLTLTGAASQADYQAALRSVTYENDSEDPSTATRTVTFTVDDGDADSADASRDVAVKAANDAPTAVDDAGTTDEDTVLNAVAPGVLANDTDPDSGDTKAVTELNGSTTLTATTTGGAKVTIAADGSYSYDPGKAFQSLSDGDDATDSFTYAMEDGAGASSTAKVTITVTGLSEPPAITTTATALKYTENDGPVAVDSGLTIEDSDSPTVEGATVEVTSGWNAAEDQLVFVNQNGITGTYDDAKGLLELSGSASAADYQTALRSITYENDSEDPSTATRTVSFKATDGTLTGSAATRDIEVAKVNDPPVAVDDTGSTDEDTPLSATAPGVLANDTDVDGGDTKTVTKLNGSGTLTGTSTDGATVTIKADGSYVYDPKSLYQHLDKGEQEDDSFTYTMEDSAGAASTATVKLTITGVADAPEAADDSYDGIGNTGLFVGTLKPGTHAGKEIAGSVETNDKDVDTDAAAISIVPATDASTFLGGKVTIEDDGNFTYTPPVGATSQSDSFSYTVTDGELTDTGTVTIPLTNRVWYVRNNAAAAGLGRSTDPFDTIAEAETAANASGDVIYVFDGDDTTTGLDTGFALEANQKLIGEAADLVVATHTLFDATGAARPTLTASNEDVVTLASGSTLAGVSIDPSGTGGGISGGAGVASSTVSDLNVTDGATAGTQPGIELSSTTGTFDFADISVTTAAADGIKLTSAGTANFAATGGIYVTATGGKALDASGTAVAGTFDALTVSSSTTGGVSLVNSSGAKTINDLNLTTTGGTGFAANNAGTLTVPDTATANVSSTNGPAVDIQSTTDLSATFTNVSSTNSSGDGINLDGNGAGTFVANAGTISGAAGIALDVNGGNGEVTYKGNIANGTGATADITGRSGGAVSVTGTVNDTNDAGGGISLSSNTGGSTTFSSGTKVLNTGTGDAVSMTSSDGHTLNLTGGGLDVDTTSGDGVEATTSGTLTVTGSNNTVATTTGRALNVTNTDIAATGLNFVSVASNGAPNGIQLDTTGSLGGLNVTGTGTQPSGGTIANSTGPGIVLNNVGGGVDFDGIAVTNGAEDGIHATSVSQGLDLVDSLISNNGGASGGGLGGRTDERGLDWLNVTGDYGIVRTTVSGSRESNGHIEFNSTATTNIDVTDSTFTNNSTDAGNTGLRLYFDGTPTVDADVTGSTFSLNKDVGFGVSTDGDSNANVDLTFDSNKASGGNAGAVSGRPQVSINTTGSTKTVARVTNNQIKSAAGAELILNPAPGSTDSFDATVSGNQIGDSQPGTADPLADAGTGIWARGAGDGAVKMKITNNTVSNYGLNGLWLQMQEGTGRADYTVSGNTITGGDAGKVSENIYVSAGAKSTDTVTTCADLQNNTFHGGVINFDLVTDRYTASTLIFPGFAGGSPGQPNTALETYLQGRGNTSATAADANFGPSNGTGTASCLQPTP